MKCSRCNGSGLDPGRYALKKLCAHGHNEWVYASKRRYCQACNRIRAKKRKEREMTTEQDILKAIESLEGKLKYYRNAIQSLRKQLIEQEARQ